MRRFRALAFFSAVLLFAFPLAAQNARGYPYYIQWTPVAGAGGYIVEVQNSDGLSVFSRQLGSESRDIELSLAPGTYRFRIVTLNNFLRFENATEWTNINILGQSAPVFVALSPTTVLTGEPIALTLQASRVAVAVTATLVSPSGARIPLTLKKLKNDLFRLSGPTLTERGNYALILSNAPKLASRKESAVSAEHPVPIVARTAVESNQLLVSGTHFSPEAIVEIMSVDGAGSPRTLELTSRSNSLLAAPLPADAVDGEWLVRISNAPDLPRTEAGRIMLARAAQTNTEALAVATPVQKNPTPPALSQPPEPVAPQPAAQPVPNPAAQPGTDQTAIASSAAPGNDRPSPEGLPGEPGTPAPKERAPREQKPLKPISHRFAIGGGVNGDILFGKWTEVYDSPVIGGYAHADFYITNHLRPETGSALDFSLGLRGDFSQLENDGSARYVQSTLVGATLLFCPALTWSRPFFRIRGYLGGGMHYGYLTAHDSTGTRTITESSGDIAAAAGMYLEYPFSDLIACALGNQFLYVMSTEPMMRNSTSLGLSVFLPVR